MTTFDDLGISFPLFTASVSEAAEYRGAGLCAQCHLHTNHTFESATSGLVCYSCLQNGRAQFSKHTVIGDVVSQDRLDAIGIPQDAIRSHGFDTLEPHPLEPDEPDWHVVRTPPGLLAELSITPNFNCFSDCTWLFCCGRPMVYRGIWKAHDFSRNAGGNGVEPFYNSVMVDACDRIPNPDPSATWPNDALDGCGGPYVFQCDVCRTFKANNDNP